jgi:hypothetical protein
MICNRGEVVGFRENRREHEREFLEVDANIGRLVSNYFGLLASSTPTDGLAWRE